MIVHTPETLQEALELKRKLGSEGLVLAGGQSLVVMLQQRLAQPEAVISLQRINELRDIQVNGSVQLGAMVTMAQAAADERIRQAAPSLSKVCGIVASPHVRNMGTVVGNACHAEPGSDPPQALLLLDAEVRAQSARGERWIPASEFFVSFLQSALAEDEIATAVRFPSQPAGADTYLKHRRRMMDLAIVGVGAMLVKQPDGRVTVRLAAGGVGPRPARALTTEEEMGARTPTDLEAIAEDVGARAAEEINPTLSDGFGSSSYRKKLVQVSTRRAIASLCRQLAGS